MLALSCSQFLLKQTLGVLLETGRVLWVWLLPHYAVLWLCPVWLFQGFVTVKGCNHRQVAAKGRWNPSSAWCWHQLPWQWAATAHSETVLTIWQPESAPCKKSQAEMSGCLRCKGRSRNVHLLRSVSMSHTPPGSTWLSTSFRGIYLLFQLILSKGCLAKMLPLLGMCADWRVTACIHIHECFLAQCYSTTCLACRPDDLVWSQFTTLFSQGFTF